MATPRKPAKKAAKKTSRKTPARKVEAVTEVKEVDTRRRYTQRESFFRVPAHARVSKPRRNVEA